MKGESPLRYIVFLRKDGTPILPLVYDGDDSKAISSAAPMENKLHIFFNWVQAGLANKHEGKEVLEHLNLAWDQVKEDMDVKEPSAMEQTPNRGKKRLSRDSVDGVPIGALELEGADISTTAAAPPASAPARPRSKRQLRKHTTADEYPPNF